MIEYITSAAILVQFAFLFYSLGFLARDELWLRGLLFLGTVFYLLYYYNIEDEPLWDAIVTSGILGAINLGMIFVLIVERTTFTMDSQTEKIFENFDTLTPGQFRKLIKLARTVSVEHDVVLSTQDTRLDHLFLVIDGEATVEKSGIERDLTAPIFLGEIAFLLHGKASAKITLKSGGQYVVWDVQSIRNLMEKSPAISNAMIALFSRDLAGKLGRSIPVERP